MLMRTEVTTTGDYTVRDQERMKLAVRYFEWQRDMSLPELGNRVLEIGCGVGNFTQHLVDRDRVIGIDVEQGCIDQHRQRFSNQQHISSFLSDILDPQFLRFENEKMNSIVCLNVLEHISDDYTALRHMHSVLPKGGRAVLIVPAFESLYGPIDELLGHYRRYSKTSMAAVAERAGFRCRKLHYFNTVGFFGWYANSHIFKKTEQSESQIRFFDSYVVPVMSKVEAVVRPPFGQSVFTVLERQ
jgi:ubiquinone/menaquinone biosynthesis C-methylase UbiE